MKELSLSGKRALVTAAGQGIGRASALAFAAQGAEVLAVDINPETLATLAETPGITTQQVDLLTVEGIDAVAAAAGTVDILLNCAGYVAAGTILDCDEDDWHRSFDMNATLMFRLTKRLLPAMIDNGGGSIINLSSVASSVKGVPNRFAYSASKAAVVGFTKAIAADYIQQGIRCNAICPGTVDTPSLHQRVREQGDYEQEMKSFVARQPLGRLGTPEEIATLAVYLASDISAFVTGQAIAIDGGWTV